MTEFIVELSIIDVISFFEDVQLVVIMLMQLYEQCLRIIADFLGSQVHRCVGCLVLFFVVCSQAVGRPLYDIDILIG
jgi:hypothetical protein